jgi:hypothetical protein
MIVDCMTGERMTFERMLAACMMCECTIVTKLLRVACPNTADWVL